MVLDDEDIEAVFRRLRRLAEIEPGSPVVIDRLPATTLDVAEQRLRQAREIADRDAGDPAVADAYRAALEVVPDSADLLLEAAEAAAAAGRNRSAREWLDSVAAASSSASERQALTARIAAAELLADENRLAESLVRLDRILADPGLGSLPELASRAGALEHRLEVARLSEMYDRIREAERITREQFAALLSAELGAPPEGAGAPSSSRSGIVIAIDIERSWAANLIRTAVGAGYLHLFPDHTFKPRAFVSRAELAEALMSALGALGPDALESASREAAARQLTDLPKDTRAAPPRWWPPTSTSSRSRRAALSAPATLLRAPRPSAPSTPCAICSAAPPASRREAPIRPAATRRIAAFTEDGGRRGPKSLPGRGHTAGRPSSAGRKRPRRRCG